MVDRLATVDPALLDAVEQLPPQTRRDRAYALADAVANRSGIRQEPTVAAALRDPASGPVPADVTSRLEQLVAALDESAWDIQDAQGDSDEYVTAFTVARAATAVLEYAQGSGDDGHLADVAYEAHAATEDLNFVRPFVQP